MIRLRGISLRLRNYFAIIEKDPILVFGFPKTGTSAIASLLAERSGLSSTIDTKYLWEPYLGQLKIGELDFKEHVKKHKYPFSKKIIKEPNMCFLVKEAINFWPKAQVIRISRNKGDTIKSILQRLGVPGNLSQNPIREVVNTNWHSLVFDGDEHYVSVLSRKYDDCLENLTFLSEHRPIDISYERFKTDKQGSIDWLCEQLELYKLKDITSLLDKQFQPKGFAISCEEFFGDNLALLDL